MNSSVIDFSKDAHWAYPFMHSVSARFNNAVFGGSFVLNAISMHHKDSPLFCLDEIHVEWLGASKHEFQIISDVLSNHVTNVYGSGFFVDINDIAFSQLGDGKQVSTMTLTVKSSLDSKSLFYIHVRVGDHFPSNVGGGYAFNYAVNNYAFRGHSPVRLTSEAVRHISNGYSTNQSLLTLYILSKDSGVNTSHIIEALSGFSHHDGRLGSWKEFRKIGFEKDDKLIDNSTINGYNRRKDIINKPDFDAVYNQAYTFLRPFISGKYKEQNYGWMSATNKQRFLFGKRGYTPYGTWVDFKGRHYK